MTQLFFLSYKDVVDGVYDAQIPSEWKYNSLHAIYYSWLTSGFHRVLYPTAFARRSVPFPKSVRVREISADMEYVFPIDYTGLVAIAIAYDLTTLPSFAALYGYLVHAAMTKKWVTMYTDDGGVHGAAGVMQLYGDEEPLDERARDPFARLSNGLFAKLRK